MIKPNYTILSIDTSCDETSAAVTQDRKIISNIISSQIDLHQEFQGVVPSIAKRAHQERIESVVARALRRAGVRFNEIDAIAVTVGPGLAIALEVGIAQAKKLALEYKKPLLAINHMEGHLLSALALNAHGNGPFAVTEPIFPWLGLLVSGGHTELVLVSGIGDYTLLGETLDDAAGEAFDKVAKMLKLGYPGGPIIEQLARSGDENRFSLPLPLAHDASLNFSYSGLKTACLYEIKKHGETLDKQFLSDFCAGFQKAAVEHLLDKLNKTHKKYKIQQIILGGGVVKNLVLRRRVRKLADSHQARVFLPYQSNLCTDNAAMIGIAAYFKAERQDFVKDIQTLDRNPVLSF